MTFPGPQSRPLHRSAAHQRTFIHEPTAHKARLLMIETARTPWDGDGGSGGGMHDGAGIRLNGPILVNPGKVVRGAEG